MSTSRGKGHVDGARWTNDMEVLFIDLMHEQVLRGNLLGSTFTPSVWNEIQSGLHIHGGHFFSVKQLRDKLTRVKMHWRRFKDLMLADSGLGWDSDRELPTTDDNWWALWEEKHPINIGLRNKPCKRYLKLCTLFERNTATGNRARSSAQLPHIRPRAQYQNADGSINVDDIHDGDEHHNLSPGFPSTSTAGSSKKRKSEGNTLHQLINSIKISNQTITSRIEADSKEKENAIDRDCKKCLDAARALPDMTTTLLLRAVQYFSEASNRSLFMQLSPFERRALLDVI